MLKHENRKFPSSRFLKMYQRYDWDILGELISSHSFEEVEIVLWKNLARIKVTFT